MKLLFVLTTLLLAGYVSSFGRFPEDGTDEYDER